MPTPSKPFVLLHHVLSDKEHWDLCLDLGDMLATWQIAADPLKNPSAGEPPGRPARRIGDHRRAYLDYEGEVSGNRGTVQRVDQGLWQPIEQAEDGWRVRLDGRHLKGVYQLPGGNTPGEFVLVPWERPEF